MTIVETRDGLIEPTPELSTLLHGDTSKLQDTPMRIVKALVSKDKDIQNESYDTYENFWNGSLEEEKRSSLYKTMTNTFYNLVTDYYEHGWGSSFHFCRRCSGESFEASIARHEHTLFDYANIKEGDKVLDVGCGVGGPARECIRFTGAHVTGINNNDYQIEKAKNYAKQCGQEANSDFVKADFLDIPFPDNTFDVVYAIEATCHSPDLYLVYKEMFRVLKPGGTFAIYEWCSTKDYDPENSKQKEIISRIEYGNGLPKLFSTDQCLKAVEKCGFELQSAKDLSVISVEGNVPWYVDLFQDYYNFSSIRAMLRTKIGAFFIQNSLTFLTYIKLIPKSATEINNLLYEAADACVQGSKNNIFTPMYLVVAKKPSN
ncbi:Cycloartenol-C-24-methyltransferase [Smittium mucronatum]|uniref:Sterol 24-C-methyltransferase n=1 Tax=Smittium mucronatum TaxID=133383 RepID=A0A1R0H745_9FUNG|nr:Cycloartenol-C-24-methyltransferase [Smittium mucronatum]